MCTVSRSNILEVHSVKEHNFRSAQCQGADFWDAQCQGAYFGCAQCQGSSFL